MDGKLLIISRKSGVRMEQGQDLKVKITNRQILSIAMPMTLAILLPQLNLLVNNMFLGHLSQRALGNAGVTGVFYMVFAVAGYGLNSALQSVMGRQAGSGESDSLSVTLSQGIRFSLILAFVFIAFNWTLSPYILHAISTPEDSLAESDFLRVRVLGLPFLFLFQMGNAFLISTLNSRWLIVGFLVQAGSNVLLDYLLIFGHGGFPALGFQGAAWASVLSEFMGLLACFGVIALTGMKKKFGLFHSFRFESVISTRIRRIATPLILQYVISLATWLVFFILIEKHGPMDKAISNTMRNVFGIAGIFVWAFAGTSTTMVSNLIGQQEYAAVRTALYRITVWSAGLCLCLIIPLNLFPHLFFQLFGQSDMFVQAGIPVIRVVSAGLIIMSVSNIWLNGLTGTGQTRVNLGIELVAITLYMLYTLYFMHVKYISLAVAWSNELVYWSVILILSMTYVLSGRWQKKVSEKS